ncbi:MAG: 3'(2'),5'-bisphosphate nucleotidase CysQ [Akkermansiaceae bacterium]|nr:3'(2'),5'-bisphosphate nucleotidase CysQ [Akkermansiaceae bacterium]NNM29627.1 3'(2'),5'-bisphosphate nucleotidase CysQ [Akkermansiaceae bacterium]
MIEAAHGVELGPLLAAARQAGARILEIYGRDFEVDYKEDQSPLTEADRAANDVIMEFLRADHPAVPVISEENRQLGYDERKDWKRFWLVDPLDGTKEFIKKNGEFTVNIALVEDGVPVLGVVYRPVTGTMYVGVHGEGAWRIEDGGAPEAISGGPHYSGKDEVKVVASRSHLTPEVEDFVARLRDEGKTVDFLSAGSSLKLCLVAEGAADVYPRFGPTMEWDTGAAHAVATAAGKKVLAVETGEDLRYNKENLLNPYFIVE